MKKSRLSYDAWKCILSKEMSGIRINNSFFNGFIELIQINEVSEKQIWKFNGENIVVCDKGLKWVIILPQDDYYCITAMMSEDGDILLWYIDMIEEQGIDKDGVPFFYDLYLDLVVYPDGTIIVDDMDELEDALATGAISKKQFNLAIETSKKLRCGMLNNINEFIDFTQKCYREVTNSLLRQ